MSEPNEEPIPPTRPVIGEAEIEAAVRVLRSGMLVQGPEVADLTFYANGAIDTEWEALRAFRGVAEGDMIRYTIMKCEPLLVGHERFRDAVGGKENDIVTLRHGLRTVEVPAAVLDSAARGETVQIPTAGTDAALASR